MKRKKKIHRSYFIESRLISRILIEINKWNDLKRRNAEEYII